MRALRSILSAFALVASSLANAQRSLPTAQTTEQVHTMSQDTSGGVRFDADPKVGRLMERYTEHKHTQRGFRVQVFLGDRKTAEETRRAFLQKYPDIPAYLSWLAPNFRLRVGDLHTRLEAEHLLRDLKVLYPGSYIVPDEVE